MLSLLAHTRQGYRPHNALMVRDEACGLRAQPIGAPPRGNRGAHQGGMHPSSLEVEPGLIIYRFSHSVYYANTELLFGQVTALVTGAAPPLKWFCIDDAAGDDVDFTGAETLRSLHGILKNARVKLVFAHVSNEVRAMLEKYAITGLIEKDAFFDSLRTVLHAYARSGTEPDSRSMDG